MLKIKYTAVTDWGRTGPALAPLFLTGAVVGPLGKPPRHVVLGLHQEAPIGRPVGQLIRPEQLQRKPTSENDEQSTQMLANRSISGTEMLDAYRY